MKSKLQWRSVWSLILIVLILNSEGIGVVNTIKISRSILNRQSIRPTHSKTLLKQRLSLTNTPNHYASHLNRSAEIINDENSFLEKNAITSGSTFDAESRSLSESEENSKENLGEMDTSLMVYSRSSKKSRKAHSSHINDSDLDSLSDRNPYSKHLRRFVESKHKEPVMTALFIANVVLTVLNFILSYIEQEIKKATENLRRSDLAKIERVQAVWRQMQESQCLFFKFLRYYIKANTVVVYIHSKIMVSKLDQMCSKGPCDKKNLQNKIKDKVKKIEELQKSLEKAIDNKVSDICSLNGEQFMDGYFKLAENERVELMVKLKISINENLDTAGSALTEVGDAIKGNEKPEENSDWDDFKKLSTDLKDQTSDYLKDKKELKNEDPLLSQKNKNDISTMSKSTKNSAGNLSNKNKLKVKPKTVKTKVSNKDFFSRGFSAGKSFYTAVSSARELFDEKEGKDNIQIIRGVLNTLTAGINFFFYLWSMFDNSIEKIAENVEKLNESIMELFEGIATLVEIMNEKRTDGRSLKNDEKKKKGNKISDHIFGVLVPASTKVAFNLAVLFTAFAADAIVGAVVDLVLTVISVCDNISKIWKAMNEYKEAVQESMNNENLIKHFTTTIRNNINYEKCESLATISVIQRMIDKNRLILKDFYVAEKGKFDSTEDKFAKPLISTFIDDICYQDVGLCLSIFNDGILKLYKSENELKLFKENAYYRSTRSAISSVAIAKNEGDELALLSMGYKQYITFKSTAYRDCGWNGIKKNQCLDKKCKWKENNKHGPWCYHDPYIELKDCGHPGISADECRNKNCEWRDNNDPFPWCFHKTFLSVMVCRGCSDTHAISNVGIQSAANNDLSNLMKNVKIQEDQKGRTISRAFSLFHKNHKHFYLVISELNLKQGDQYLTDFEIRQNLNSDSGLDLILGQSSKFEGRNDYSFSNRNTALAGGIYPFVIKQNMKDENVCQTSEGRMVFLARKDNHILYLAKENVDCNKEAISKHRINKDNNAMNMEHIYDFVLPGVVHEDKLNKMHFVNEHAFFKKRLYHPPSSTQLGEIKLTEASFEPIFKPKNPLYDIVNQNLCKTRETETCYFQDDTIIQTVQNEMCREYYIHNLRNIAQGIKESHKQLFVNLERKLNEGKPITLAEFNRIGLSHQNMGAGHQTVYKFFVNLSKGQTGVYRKDMYYDYFKFLVPITFEKQCPYGEKSLYFDEDLGPVETCLNERPNNGDSAWLPIESNYYIYFHHRQHSKIAGELTHFTFGWIPHPDMSRGFNYWGGSRHKRASKSLTKNKGKMKGDYEFTYEVYVRPFFGSGYVPVGKNYHENGSCLNSIFPLPSQSEAGSSEQSITNTFIERNNSPLNREYVDKNGLYNVYFGVRGDQRFLYYSLYLFFNNPTYYRRKNKGNYEFKPNTMADWSNMYGKSCPSFFSTEECRYDYRINQIMQNCKSTKNSFFFPVRMADESDFLEFQERGGNIFLEETKDSESSNRIDNVFYFEMKAFDEQNSNREFYVDYGNDDVKRLVDFGYRLFLVPSRLKPSKHGAVKDGHFRKKWANNVEIAFRFWVRDDLRIPFKREDVCGREEIRIIPKHQMIPEGWRIITLEEGKDLASTSLRPLLRPWSFVGFDRGHIETKGDASNFEIKDVRSPNCGEIFIVHW